MRFPILLFSALLIAAAPAEELLPIPASVRGASRIAEIEIRVRPGAAQALAALDDKARGRDGAAGLPTREMLTRTIAEQAAAWGLNDGRALKLLVEIDGYRTPDAGGALLGKRDQLAGSVFVRDAATAQALGHLYIEIDNAHVGLIGLALRGGGVREKLAGQFAMRTARALSGRKKPLKPPAR